MASRFAFILVAFTLVVPAFAQDMPAALPNNFVLSDILDRQRMDAIIAPDHGSGQTAGSAARREGPGRTVTTYHPSREVSARVRRQFAEWTAGLSRSKDGRRIAAGLNERDPVRSWAKIVGGDGLKPGDMVDAVTSYWILNWVMANGTVNTRAEAQAVRRQVRRMIAASPSQARLKEAGRQQISEVLMLNFLIEHAAYADAKARGDSGTAGRLGEAAVARFQKELGVDLRELRLTDAGFTRN